MSDPRFARLKSDPRFRRPKVKQTKVVIDERFKSVFEQPDNKSKAKAKKGKAGRKVDKYGRAISDTQTQEDLRRYYRLEQDADEDAEGNERDEAEAEAEGTEDEGAAAAASHKPDLARGEVLLESSDEEEGDEEDEDEENSDSDEGGFVTLGGDSSRPIDVRSGELEVDLDEDEGVDEGAYADLDAQAARYSKTQRDAEGQQANTKTETRTSRLAIVNLDWEHVRAHHLYKICASLVSPSAPAVVSAQGRPSSSSSLVESGSGSGSASRKRSTGRAPSTTATTVVRGRVHSVRVYPSEFGRERMAREEKEGPPAEIFIRNRRKRDGDEEEEEVNEKTIYEVGGGEEEEYDEDALRRYQLDRLRYYYAIVECDTVDAASHIYDELEGTELERSANVFDMSFVPEDMVFEHDPRDEASGDLNTEYKAVEFVTSALRHSKVKLTWDEDDPERHQVTRRALTKKEIEENDFRAYIANTSSEESDADSDVDVEVDVNADDADKKSSGKKTKTKKDKKNDKKASRDKLRSLLLGGNDDAIPEGWGGGGGYDDDGGGGGGGGGDVDMEITFTPGLSGKKKSEEDETTLERYQRKMKEKRKKRKEESVGLPIGATNEKKKGDVVATEDDFFEATGDAVAAAVPLNETGTKAKDKLKKGKKTVSFSSGPASKDDDDEGVTPTQHKEATAEELSLLVASDNPTAEPKHFNIKAVLKAEKLKKRRFKGRKKGALADGEDNEAQEDFVMDVKDERFKVLFEDHQFAIDPSNPQFKKTKAMTALLDERQKRRREQRDEQPDDAGAGRSKSTLGVASGGGGGGGKSLQSLVESVKRKSVNVDLPGQGKRRKL